MQFTLASAVQAFMDGNGWNIVLIIVTGIGGGIIFWLKGKDSINQGEAGFVLRNGAVRKDKNGQPILRGPGLILLLPWIDKLWRTSVQQRTQNLSHKLREEKLNGRLVGYQDIEAVVFYRVTDPYLALNESQNLDGQVTSLCNEKVQILVKDGKTDAEIREQLPLLVEDELKAFGVTFIKVLIEFTGDTFATQTARSLAAAGLQVTVPFLPIIGDALNGNGHIHGPTAIVKPLDDDVPTDTQNLS